MKTRTGFVSNSSSSSFVVAFNKVPETQEELREQLFPNGETGYVYEGLLGINTYSVEKVAGAVWQDMKDMQPLNEAEIIEVFKSGYIDGMPSFAYDFGALSNEEADVLDNEHVAEVANKFYSQHHGYKFYSFHYSDNDGDFDAALEHGELFHSLPHFVISNH